MYYNKRPGVSEAFYGNSEGRFYTASGWTPNPNVAEPRTKEWYLEAARYSKLVLTGPDSSRKSHKKVLTFSLPLSKKKERMRGVLGLEIYQEAIAQEIARGGSLKAGISILMHTETDSLIAGQAWVNGSIPISLDSLQAKVAEIGPYRNTIPLPAGQGVYFIYEEPQTGQDLLVCISRFSHAPLDLIYIADTQRVLANVHDSITQIVMVAVGGILLLVAFTTLIGRSLFRRTIGKELEDSVRSSTLFETMLASRYVSLILTDSDFFILHASASVARLQHEFDIHSLKGAPLWSVIAEHEFQAFVERCLEHPDAPEEDQVLLLPLTNRDGETIWWNNTFRT